MKQASQLAQELVDSLNTRTDAEQVALVLPYCQTLSMIANLWPQGTSASIMDVGGVNDGKSRAIYLKAAVDAARKLLDIPATPK